METKTTPVHPLLPGTSVECRGRNYRVIEGPDNLGFYALYGADFRAVFHATESELTVLSAPPSLAAENAALAEQVDRLRAMVDRAAGLAGLSPWVADPPMKELLLKFCADARDLLSTLNLPKP